MGQEEDRKWAETDLDWKALEQVAAQSDEAIEEDIRKLADERLKAFVALKGAVMRAVHKGVLETRLGGFYVVGRIWDTYAAAHLRTYRTSTNAEQKAVDRKGLMENLLWSKIDHMARLETLNHAIAAKKG